MHKTKFNDLSFRERFLIGFSTLVVCAAALFGVLYFVASSDFSFASDALNATEQVAKDDNAQKSADKKDPAVESDIVEGEELPTAETSGTEEQTDPQVETIKPNTDFSFKNLNDENNNETEPNDITIDIYTTNDIHGDISQVANNDSTKDKDGNPINYGLSFANMAKLKNDNSILVDAGDHSSGGVYANFDKGHTMVKLMKMCGYDFAVPGNHEFDAGRDNFFNNLIPYAESDEDGGSFSYYACNFYNVDPSTDERTSRVLHADKPYKIVTVGSKKIALVGVMTPETIYKTAPSYFQNEAGQYIYNISSGRQMYTDFQEVVNQAKLESPDLIVGVGHLGVDASSAEGGNTSKQLVANTTGIDAFVDGHSHTVIPSDSDDGKWNNYSGATVFAVQTGTAFANVGHLKFVEDSTNGYTITNEALSKNTFTYDKRNDTVYQAELAWKNYVDGELNNQIAKSDISYYLYKDNDSGQERYSRRRETNLTDLVADSYYWKANTAEMGGADVSIVNGGAMKAFIDAGSVITRKDARNISPYGNFLAVATMKGSLLREALEFSYMYYAKKGYDEKSNYVYIENGGLMACSGLSFTVDEKTDSTVQTVGGEGKIWSGAPTGEYRVKNIKIYNKQTGTYDDIDLNKDYRVAGTSYFFVNYGDGFEMFKDCSKVDSAPSTDSDALEEYLKNFNKANPADALSTLSTATSPLSQLANFQINYEAPFGANRVGLYNVSFDTDGGSQVPPQNLYYNLTVQKPTTNPVKADKDFRGWYSDKAATAEYDFNSVVDSDKVIYAKWTNKAVASSGAPQTYDPLQILYLLILVCGLGLCAGTGQVYKRYAVNGSHTKSLTWLKD